MWPFWKNQVREYWTLTTDQTGQKFISQLMAQYKAEEIDNLDELDFTLQHSLELLLVHEELSQKPQTSLFAPQLPPPPRFPHSSNHSSLRAILPQTAFPQLAGSSMLASQGISWCSLCSPALLVQRSFSTLMPILYFSSLKLQPVLLAELLL